ncbi:MAG: hypothetical protein ABF991_00490 [Liquorilactobacillus hordei]|uniref:hypothetical protein n=1 Tax=Liquorilactobacillus hordei TaxID=468911 RepID=UPI0039E78090
MGKEQLNIVKLNAAISDLFDRAEELKKKLPSQFVQNGVYSYDREGDAYAKFRKYFIQNRSEFMDSSADFKADFEDWVSDVQDLTTWVYRHKSLNNCEGGANSTKFLLLNSSYGYLDKNMGYSSFDLQDAALFSEQNIRNFNQDFINKFIKIPMTETSIAKLPFDLPTYNNPLE